MTQESDSSTPSITILNVTRGGPSAKDRETDAVFAVYDFPVEELRDRTIELPPRNETRLILYSPNAADLEEARVLLGNAWEVANAFTDWGDLVSSREAKDGRLPLAHTKRARLWSPNPCLEANVAMIEERIASSSKRTLNEEKRARTSSPPRTSSSIVKPMCAVDLGCGTGRDVVFLACERKWERVVGVDRVKDFLDKLTRFAARCEAPPGAVHVLHADLSRIASSAASSMSTRIEKTLKNADDAVGEIIDPLSPTFLSQFDLIVISRFMEKSILHRLAEPGVMRPGTFILVHHFAVGAVSNATRRSMRREQTLESGELERDFFIPERGFEVCVSLMSRLSDGRDMIDFVAVKRSRGE